MPSKKISLFKKLAEPLGISDGSEILIDFLNSLSEGRDMDDIFFSKALERIREEVDEELNDEFNDREELLRSYWSTFFPEALLIDRNYDEVFAELRKKRAVRVSSANSDPVSSVPAQMTFTSNALLTVPDRNTPLDDLDLPESIKEKIPALMDEEQLFWFDHPVQMGEVPEKNEIIYGLKGLSEAFAFEKARGTVEADTRLDVILSVSVTHHGLQELAAPYMRYELSRSEEIRDLNIYIFTEKDCREILDAYSDNQEGISEFFGVDGKYGRHYNFLKAVNVLWRSAMNPQLRGTFKIDLDQVFPQEELVSYTGQSAFEHFQSPLWGAEAVDHEGLPVSLSMIAGALVNESDIGKSLYTPDVSIPTSDAPLSDLVFFKHLTMSLSTRAEMMTRYDEEKVINGTTTALSRIHVTGGTNGILIDALLQHRPFTPAFIGRAEDQAFILSVLNSEEPPRLRYYHEDGLIMRHDKHAFAGQSIEAAKDGTFIADILRILFFSRYAEALPGGFEKMKESTFPFTGSYISRYPVTMAYMRLVFKLLEMYGQGEKDRADAMLELGKERISEELDRLDESNYPAEEFIREREVWNDFYDEVIELDKSIADGSDIALQRRRQLKEVFQNCRIV